jgi:hypothetical protein
MPLGDVLKQDDVLYVLGLMKSLISVACMIDLKCMVEFDSQQVVIRDNNHELSKVLDRGV